MRVLLELAADGLGVALLHLRLFCGLHDHLVKDDFDDVASLRAALAGVSAAFSVKQWTQKGP